MSQSASFGSSGGSITTPVSVPNGGTGDVSGTAHTVMLWEGTSAVGSAGPGSTGQVLQSNGSSADPSYSTATYPSTTTINQLLYSSANNIVGGISTAANGVLVTNNSSVPSVLANSGTASFVLTANSGAPPSWQSPPHAVAKWIVNPTANLGTHTTIASALTSSAAGDTIFIMPGTYSENLTFKNNVNLTAFDCDAYKPNVTIQGSGTFSGNGAVAMSGIQFLTNSATCITVSGSTTGKLNFINCFFSCLNSVGITISSTSTNCIVNIENCSGSIGSTGSFFNITSTQPVLNIFNSNISNATSSTVSNSTCLVNIYNSYLQTFLTTSSSGYYNIYNSIIDTVGFNVTALNLADTAGFTSLAVNSYFSGGSTSAIQIGASATLDLYNCVVDSTNTNPITGSGALNYANVTFSASGIINNTTTSTPNYILGGYYLGVINGNAIPSGAIGQVITSSVASGSAVAATTGSNVNVTSISLTAGSWVISGIVNFTGMTTATIQNASISTTSATQGTAGLNKVSTTFSSTTLSDISLSIPSYPLDVSGSTTVYLVGGGTYSAGTGKVYGSITATRKG